MREIGSFDYIKTYNNIIDDGKNYINFIYIYKFHHHYNCNYIAFTTELNPDLNFNDQHKGKRALIAFKTLEEMDQWLTNHSC